MKSPPAMEIRTDDADVEAGDAPGVPRSPGGASLANGRGLTLFRRLRSKGRRAMGSRDEDETSELRIQTATNEIQSEDHNRQRILQSPRYREAVTERTVEASVSMSMASTSSVFFQEYRANECHWRRFMNSNPVVILDWDDTLLPTSWLSDSARINTPLQTVQRQLRPLAAAIRRLFEVCNQCECHVSIVTNAGKGWVEETCKVFFPSLQRLLCSSPRRRLQENSLPRPKVISARTLFQHRFPNDPTVWKAEAFTMLLDQLDRERLRCREEIQGVQRTRSSGAGSATSSTHLTMTQQYSDNSQALGRATTGVSVGSSPRGSGFDGSATIGTISEDGPAGAASAASRFDGTHSGEPRPLIALSERVKATGEDAPDATTDQPIPQRDTGSTLGVETMSEASYEEEVHATETESPKIESQKTQASSCLEASETASSEVESSPIHQVRSDSFLAADLAALLDLDEPVCSQLISIGDSKYEHEACRRVAAVRSLRSKTMHMFKNGTPEVIARQLAMISDSLDQFLVLPGDVDVDVDD
eukprot:scaffold870_cov268-Pinguiococcus_pyrenoidosus.AAC.45